MQRAKLTARIFFKLSGIFFVLLLGAMACVDLVVSRIVERGYIRTLQHELTTKARLMALEWERHGMGMDLDLGAVASATDSRLTVIDSSGKVLVDTDANPARMENHRERPEFREALAGQNGSSTRRSPTIGVNYLYVAVPLSSGALRLAVPLSEIDKRVGEIRTQAMIAIGAAFVPAILLAAWFARRISSRLGQVIDFAGELAHGNFQARLEAAGRDELGILSNKLNETGEKLEEMVRRLEQEHANLERLEQVRKDFVINVSHELRTPLASIQGYTETLLDGALEDRAHNRRFLEIIRQNAERLTALTADLMTLSRIELGNRALRLGFYDVNVLLSDAMDFIRPLAEKKAIRLECERAPDGTDAFCDAEAVHQILSNLLDNAVKYTPEGRSIVLGARVAGEPGRASHTVELFVRDTGIGIPPDDVPRLFERFYRVDKARSRELGGTGLGLAIVKHLVRAQGGEVRVESEVNKGTTFTFTLPACDLSLEQHAGVHREFTAL